MKLKYALRAGEERGNESIYYGEVKRPHEVRRRNKDK